MPLVILYILLQNQFVPVSPPQQASNLTLSILGMLFSKRSLSFALTLGFATADVTSESTPVGSLYAYGSGLSGLPVIYSDGEIVDYTLEGGALLTYPPGVAVLGWGQPSIATVATNLTCECIDRSTHKTLKLI